MKHTKKRTERQRKKWALIGLAFFLVATVLICWQVGLPMVRLASDPENFRQWLEERKLGGLLIYGAMVFFQVLFAVIPGEPLEIAGGYAFGAVWGTLVCLVAATLGSLLVFGLVRRFGTRLVEVFFPAEKLRAVRFLQSSPKRTILFLVIFMIPGTPKDLLCYFAGLTDIKFPVFLLVCSWADCLRW
ncbi:MAG: TVP38/TMEM64 family protein [Evtepia gabavorous]